MGTGELLGQPNKMLGGGWDASPLPGYRQVAIILVGFMLPETGVQTKQPYVQGGGGGGGGVVWIFSGATIHKIIIT